MIPKGLLPPDYMDCAFIAGGYAACPPLARDIDLWVMVNPSQSLAAVREEILAWLESELWPYEVQDDRRLRPLGTTAEGYDIIATKVAVVKSLHMSHPIHIMLVDRSPRELLETFDISTHQVAIVFGNVIKGSGWTPITEPPRQLKDSPTTAARMEKIAQRYGHSLTPQGVR